MSKGAELGVFRGVFSEFILKTVEPKLFYMVDGWELLFGPKFTWGGDYTCNGTLPTHVAKLEAAARARPEGPYIQEKILQYRSDLADDNE